MAEQRPTVVHLFGVLDAGGAETRTLEVLRGRGGREAHVLVALTGRAGSLDEQFRALGCTVVPRRLSPTFPFWFVRYLRRSGATHVHSHVQLASGYLLALAAVAGVPRRIAVLWSTGDGRERAGAGRRLYRWLGRRLLVSVATDVVAVSRSVADEVIPGRGRSRVRVAYAGVDPSRFVPPAAGPVGDRPNAPTLIAVGRLDREKNPLRSVEVLAALRKRRPEATLRLAGRYTADERESLEQRIDELGLDGAVEVLGPRDDVPDLLAAADLLISPTLREGLPGAILEAVAAGVPAVVSAIPPNEEVASLVPGVIPVPLAASDDAWCDVIEDVLDERAGRFSPAAVRLGLEESPLTLATNLAAHDELWR